jgi:hypothetical protein
LALLLSVERVTGEQSLILGWGIFTTDDGLEVHAGGVWLGDLVLTELLVDEDTGIFDTQEKTHTCRADIGGNLEFTNAFVDQCVLSGVPGEETDAEHNSRLYTSCHLFAVIRVVTVVVKTEGSSVCVRINCVGLYV